MEMIKAGDSQMAGRIFDKVVCTSFHELAGSAFKDCSFMKHIPFMEPYLDMRWPRFQLYNKVELQDVFENYGRQPVVISIVVILFLFS